MIRKLLPITALFLVACGPEVVIDTPPVAATSSSSSRIASSPAALPPATSAPAATTSSPPAMKDTLPPSVLIKVPFTVQAPYANWDELHEETCEEAALLMVQRFWTKGTLSEQTAETELQAMVKWETENGYGYDVNMVELLDVAKRHYGLNGYIETEVTVEKIKEILAKGYPIIIPAAGRELGNPYFSGEGPWYHVLTVVGYDAKNFITHDPGTKRGEGYKYEQNHLVSVIHDWTGVKEETNTGQKRMLVITK